MREKKGHPWPRVASCFSHGAVRVSLVAPGLGRGSEVTVVFENVVTGKRYPGDTRIEKKFLACVIARICLVVKNSRSLYSGHVQNGAGQVTCVAADGDECLALCQACAGMCDYAELSDGSSTIQ